MGHLVIISCESVHKEFEGLKVLEGVDISIEEGEFLVLLGPSGCGKSTLLNLIAGFEKPTTGTVRFRGEDVRGPGRHYGFVFQDYALFPWLTVQGNVESGLLHIWDRKERRDAARRYIDLVGLGEFAGEYPYKLSGGMKQRVGIARALAYDPDVLLMDEPFGALDAQTRKLMQQELSRILRDMGKTIIFVTHSVVEAVYLATRVIVFSRRPSRIIYEERIDLDPDRHYTEERYMRYRETILRHLNPETGIRE